MRVSKAVILSAAIAAAISARGAAITGPFQQGPVVGPSSGSSVFYITSENTAAAKSYFGAYNTGVLSSSAQDQQSFYSGAATGTGKAWFDGEFHAFSSSINNPANGSFLTNAGTSFLDSMTINVPGASAADAFLAYFTFTIRGDANFAVVGQDLPAGDASVWFDTGTLGDFQNRFDQKFTPVFKRPGPFFDQITLRGLPFHSGDAFNVAFGFAVSSRIADWYPAQVNSVTADFTHTMQISGICIADGNNLDRTGFPFRAALDICIRRTVLTLV